MPFRLPVLLATLLVLACQGHACTIPVFRYALDRWPADPFHVTAPTAWARAEVNSGAIGLLRAEAVANLELKEAPDGKSPRIFFPREMAQPLGLDDWSEAGVRHLLDSPARRELAKRILAGESVVWVMVESGHAEADNALAARLEKRLGYLVHVASLPAQDPQDPESQLGPGPPLQLKFSVLRVAKDDAAEQPLVHMLAGPQGTKFLQGSEPFAAPVFGRGRVLGAWMASELDETGIEDTSLFLIGRCSCRVKNENPGWDILMKVAWDKELETATNVASVSPEPPPPAPEELPSLEERVADVERYMASLPPSPPAKFAVHIEKDGMMVTTPGWTVLVSWVGIGCILAALGGIIWLIVASVHGGGSRSGPSE